ncbi:MAG TPA: hypothetical protein VEF04_16415, partial [Blastocatellia bacterium]|nr:hypothetical protein [Blastocatellia bacterium]
HFAVSSIETALVLTLYLLVGLSVFKYAAHPTSKRAKLIENLSGVWVLFVYLFLGLIPLIFR